VIGKSSRAWTHDGRGSGVTLVALRPKAIIHVTDRGGGSGFDWGAASAGAASVVAIVLVAGGAPAGVRNRRRIAIP